MAATNFSKISATMFSIPLSEWQGARLLDLISRFIFIRKCQPVFPSAHSILHSYQKNEGPCGYTSSPAFVSAFVILMASCNVHLHLPEDMQSIFSYVYLPSLYFRRKESAHNFCPLFDFRLFWCLVLKEFGIENPILFTLVPC